MCYTSIGKFYIVQVQYVVNQLQKNDNKPKNMDKKLQLCLFANFNIHVQVPNYIQVWGFLVKLSW